MILFIIITQIHIHKLADMIPGWSIDIAFLRGNAYSHQKFGIMGVLRFSWYFVILEVLMIVFEPQKDLLSKRPTPDIMENKEIHA